MVMEEHLILDFNWYQCPIFKWETWQHLLFFIRNRWMNALNLQVSHKNNITGMQYMLIYMLIYLEKISYI